MLMKNVRSLVRGIRQEKQRHWRGVCVWVTPRPGCESFAVKLAGSIWASLLSAWPPSQGHGENKRGGGENHEFFLSSLEKGESLIFFFK